MDALGKPKKKLIFNVRSNKTGGGVKVPAIKKKARKLTWDKKSLTAIGLEGGGRP